ncbi:MAG: hypothetical protein MAG458_01722 [Nitrosopumilus sp.]|nr:hypothetical protein [Nitrosopumilus sp.]
MSQTTKSEVGALESVFSCSESRVLDHMITFRDFDYSISDISRSVDIGFKTTLGVVHKLERQNVLVLTRQIGNAKLYKLNSNSTQAKSLSKLCFEIAKNRIAQN